MLPVRSKITPRTVTFAKNGFGLAFLLFTAAVVCAEQPPSICRFADEARPIGEVAQPIQSGRQAIEQPRLLTPDDATPIDNQPSGTASTVRLASENPSRSKIVFRPTAPKEMPAATKSTADRQTRSVDKIDERAASSSTIGLRQTRGAADLTLGGMRNEIRLLVADQSGQAPIRRTPSISNDPVETGAAHQTAHLAAVSSNAAVDESHDKVLVGNVLFENVLVERDERPIEVHAPASSQPPRSDDNQGPIRIRGPFGFSR